MGSGLEPIKKVAGTIKDHLWEILNAVVLEVSNGLAESLSSRIKMIKVHSRGFRNKKRFASAIYLHLGGLNLYPEGVVDDTYPLRLGEELINLSREFPLGSQLRFTLSGEMN
ncbi:transposase [Candidatus Vondammii sp. HM_W22]|uniref:transposase n=1 Tax=Candidatus Vondammii sp. HM_W22 TaxID=2687299 RepID=UPI001F13B15E|nr:transposase [Candidatus Vondammii sp. HM_W22]